VLGWSVTLMTRKLLMVYAFNAFAVDRHPDLSQFTSYLFGTQHGQPMDSYSFPSMLGDLTEIQNEALGSPMYGPSGMLLALAVLGVPLTDIHRLVGQFQDATRTLDTDKSKEAMKLAFAGSDSSNLNLLLFQAFRDRSTDVEFTTYRRSAVQGSASIEKDHSQNGAVLDKKSLESSDGSTSGCVFMI